MAGGLAAAAAARPAAPEPMYTPKQEPSYAYNPAPPPPPPPPPAPQPPPPEPQSAPVPPPPPITAPTPQPAPIFTPPQPAQPWAQYAQGFGAAPEEQPYQEDQPYQPEPAPQPNGGIASLQKNYSPYYGGLGGNFEELSDWMQYQ